MKPTIFALCGLSTFLLLVGSASSAALDGRSVFVTHCQFCHSLRSEGIAAGHGREALQIDWTRLCDDCTQDLSDVARRRKNPGWLKGYLKGQKKGRNGLKHNELPVIVHGRRYIVSGGASPPTLTAEEVDVLVNWLVTLKQM